MKTVRCFLALNLSVETARAISDEQKKLKETCDTAGVQVRWVPPQNMHVTVRFLGQITEPMIRVLKDNLERATRSIAPFDMEMKSIGAFPDTLAPKVIWAGVGSDDSQLERLYLAVAKVLEDTGFKNDSKPFKSHVTIGRVKEGSAGISSCMEDTEGLGFGRTHVRDLVCYRSDLHHKGADYHLLWRLPLTGRVRREKEPEASYTEPEAMNTEPEGTVEE